MLVLLLVIMNIVIVIIVVIIIIIIYYYECFYCYRGRQGLPGRGRSSLECAWLNSFVDWFMLVWLQSFFPLAVRGQLRVIRGIPLQ